MDSEDRMFFKLSDKRWVNQVKGSMYESQAQKIVFLKVFQLIC